VQTRTWRSSPGSGPGGAGPTDPFGEELVTTLSTSCLLHANLARLDVAEEQKRLGLLDGQPNRPLTGEVGPEVPRLVLGAVG